MGRREAQAVRDERDQRRQIRLFARDIAAISRRVRPVYEIMRTASAVEPEMAAIYSEMEGYRLRNMRQAARWIAARGPLRVKCSNVLRKRSGPRQPRPREDDVRRPRLDRRSVR